MTVVVVQGAVVVRGVVAVVVSGRGFVVGVVQVSVGRRLCWDLKRQDRML